MSIARWTLLSRTQALARSSHCLSVTGTGHAVLYSGELKPRTPVDAEEGSKGAIHTYDVAQARKGSASVANWQTVVASEQQHIANHPPEPRVGAASTTIGEVVYLWGGRGGVDMGAPIAGEEAGVWAIDLTKPEKAVWQRVKAMNESEAPQPRSYHTMTSLGSTIYVHAGCPASGRIGELHSFDTLSATWKQLASAPDPGRGGTVLAPTKLNKSDVFLRFAGFAGFELGEDHKLDVYDVAQNTWSTVTPSPDASHGYPGPRSVHGFVGFNHPKWPSAVALLYHGEQAPSTQGHAGAGSFWDDVWLLQVGNKTPENGGLEWKYVPVEGFGPEGRGWFPSASYTDEGGLTRVVLHGGLLSSNARSDELWLLEID